MTAIGLRRVIPGVALLIAVGAIAWVVGQVLPTVPPIVVAIILGAAIANVVGVPKWADAGLATYKLQLETAIVLLGASVSVAAILQAGPRLLVLVVGVVVLGLVFVELLARVAGLAGETGSLLAAGSSVCGVSAIAAVAATCRARSGVVAHAAGTIVLFDAIALAVLPILGGTLGLDPRAFGVWVGLTMFSTGPVTAAGFAYSPVAGEWATVTKLARNSLIGLVAVTYSIHYATSARGEETDRVGDTGEALARTRLKQVVAGVPPFLIGFVILALIANAGLLPSGTRSTISMASSTLFLFAFAGLGFELRWQTMRSTGAAPVAVVGTYLVVVATVTYVAVTTMW